MPNIKSAKKRVEVIKKKTMRNNSIKSGYKTAIKKVTLAKFLAISGIILPMLPK